MPHTAHPLRRVRVLGAALLACGLALGAATSAHAADPSDSSENSLSVSVPAAPAPPPPNPPPLIPPVDPPAIPPGTPPGTATTPGGAGKPGGPAVTGGAAGTGPAPGGAATCVPREPTLPRTPATNARAATADKDVYRPGDEVTATVDGYGAGEQVQLVLFSEPTLVGSFTADATGAVRAGFTVPDKTLPGTHTVQFTGWCDGVASVELLIASEPSAAAGGNAGLPTWIWWVGGGLGVAALLVGGWYVLRVMRAPALGEAVTA